MESRCSRCAGRRHYACGSGRND